MDGGWKAPGVSYSGGHGYRRLLNWRCEERGYHDDVGIRMELANGPVDDCRQSLLARRAGAADLGAGPLAGKPLANTAAWPLRAGDPTPAVRARRD